MCVAPPQVRKREARIQHLQREIDKIKAKEKEMEELSAGQASTLVRWAAAQRVQTLLLPRYSTAPRCRGLSCLLVWVARLKAASTLVTWAAAQSSAACWFWVDV